MKEYFTTVCFNESCGIIRDNEPVTWGMPFPPGLVENTSKLILHDENQNRQDFFCTPASFWNDGSIKWLIFDTQISMDANSEKKLMLYSSSDEDNYNSNSNLKCHEEEGIVSVQTGAAAFYVQAMPFAPFHQVVVNDKKYFENDSLQIKLEDKEGRIWEPDVDEWHIETSNPFRLVLHFTGRFKSAECAKGLDFSSRIHFYNNKKNVRLDFTISNPNAARHIGCTWDLGDPGSFFFKDLSFFLRIKHKDPIFVSYKTHPNNTFIQGSEPVTIYQDSSGGENWYSRNHINQKNEIPLEFRGYKVISNNKTVSNGNRAEPFMAVGDVECGFGAGVRNFWENFPKSMEVSGNNLVLGLFPDKFGDFYELQGGEQKTHTIDFCLAGKSDNQDLYFRTQDPLIPRISPEWYYNSKACSRPLPATEYKNDILYQEYNEMINVAVKGKKSFFNRREIIDEYGWRNFGDIYSDHEAVFHKDSVEFISHYNNQFDVIMGGLTQFFRTSDERWFRLAKEHADHVSDIDIYHTDDDKYQYNHGLFWHTDHHLDAATSTHRSVSEWHKKKKDPHLVGGGPSWDHNYATGFLYLYWLTGERRYKDCVLELAGNVVEGIKGPDTLCETSFLTVKRLVNQLRDHLGESEQDQVYGLTDGPGRASGNALNTLLDAYLLTRDRCYLEHAEYLMVVCISPEDNIAERNLGNVEFRWMYTVFLKALCRYVEIKAEHNQMDDMYSYARRSLEQYGEWMLENEYPYLEKPEILEFPNESWPAQELRKSDILAFVSTLVSGDLKYKMKEKSRYFFEQSIIDLKSFENWFLTRPVVLMMRNGIDHLALSQDEFHDPSCGNQPDKQNKYTTISSRLSQKSRLIRILNKTSPAREWRWFWNRIEDRYR